MSYKLFSKLLTESYPKINMTFHYSWNFCDSVSGKINLEHVAPENNTINKCSTYFPTEDNCFKDYFCN